MNCKNSINPLISIIIPVYNGENQILHTIDDLLILQVEHIMQLEIIIVDDKSTDNTLAIIRTLNHPTIRVIESSMNLGSAGARNLGLEASKGEYIFFIDSDDSISHDFFFRLQQVFNSQIDCFLFDMHWQYGDYTEIYHFKNVNDKRDLGRLGSVCNKIFRKKMLPKFISKFRYYEDTIFIFEYLDKNGDISIFKIDDVYYKYNKNIQSAKSAYFDKKAYIDTKQYIFNVAKRSDKLTKMLCLETYIGVLFTTSYPLDIKLNVFISVVLNFYKELLPVINKPIRKNMTITTVSNI